MTTYIVSESPDHIDLSGEDTVSQYADPEAAGNAIKNGYHGEYGRKYVLSIEINGVAAEYDRQFVLIKKED